MNTSKKVTRETAEEIENLFGKSLVFTIDDDHRVSEVSFMHPDQKQFVVVRPGTCTLTVELVTNLPKYENRSIFQTTFQRLEKLTEEKYRGQSTWLHLFIEEFGKKATFEFMTDKDLLIHYDIFHEKQASRK